MKNDECKMQNDLQGGMFLIILHSSFYILHSKDARVAQREPAALYTASH